MAKKIMTVSELAEHLSVHRITIYRLLKGGALPGFKIGRVWRFDLDEIANWMASGKAERELIASDESLAPAREQPAPNGLAKDGRRITRSRAVPRDTPPSVHRH